MATPAYSMLCTRQEASWKSGRIDRCRAPGVPAASLKWAGFGKLKSISQRSPQLSFAVDIVSLIFSSSFFGRKCSWIRVPEHTPSNPIQLWVLWGFQTNWWGSRGSRYESPSISIINQPFATIDPFWGSHTHGKPHFSSHVGEAWHSSLGACLPPSFAL